MNKNIFKKTSSLILNLIMVLISASCIFPIIWMIYSSLKTQKEFALSIIKLPETMFFENYVKAMVEGKLFSYFMNSMFNTIITVVLSAAIVFVSGYCLSRFEFKGRKAIYYFFLSGMLIPIYALLIPLFLEFNMLNLLNRRVTLLIPYIAFALPTGIFLLESFVKTIPKEMEEAAYIDGASLFYTMVNIILPMCKPVLSTIVILNFLGTWNEFPLALVLISNAKLKTMPIGLTNFIGEYTVNYPLMFSALVISTLPVLIIYLLFYNQIMKGMAQGSVKG